MPRAICEDCGALVEAELTHNGVCLVGHYVHCGWGHVLHPDDLIPDDAAAAEIERLRAEVEELEDAGEALIGIVEGIDGAMTHGTWRAEKSNLRMKDTDEWVRFYCAVRARAAFREDYNSAADLTDKEEKMSDILEKLENWERVYPEDYDKSDGHLYVEAADEIERLRAALRDLDKAASDVARHGAQTGPQWSKLTIAILKAREALIDKGERHEVH